MNTNKIHSKCRTHEIKPMLSWYMCGVNSLSKRGGVNPPRKLVWNGKKKYAYKKVLVIVIGEPTHPWFCHWNLMWYIYLSAYVCLYFRTSHAIPFIKLQIFYEKFHSLTTFGQQTLWCIKNIKVINKSQIS